MAKNNETIYDKSVIELRNNREPIVKECEGCAYIEAGRNTDPICAIYAYPKAKHSIAGGCPKATNRVDEAEEAKKKFVNPLKAAKRQYDF